ncbi:unnamed protein product [Urochloa humidicola]
MQADKEETKSAAAPAAGKQPSVRDRLQRAFHASPAVFRPLRRLTVRHQDGGGAAKPADASAAPKHSGPPVPAPPQPPKPSPVRVRLPAVTEKAAAASAPPGPPVPVPPPDVTAGMVVTPAADAKDGDKAKSRVGFRVRKQALSSK